MSILPVLSISHCFWPNDICLLSHSGKAACHNSMVRVLTLHEALAGQLRGTHAFLQKDLVLGTMLQFYFPVLHVLGHHLNHTTGFIEISGGLLYT
ncbi:hypothetical protein ZEAMMB73_Zm00001d010281 [Zea mays]|nr:hypothetical protein ZEAMMB73_Zm00001d010281 [Zea mays]